MWKKFARIPLSLPKRGSGVSPIWGGKKNFFGPITFRTHIGAPILFTFRTYIQNYIQKLHFNIHQTAPFTYLSTRSLARSFTHLPRRTKLHSFYLHLEHTLEVHQNYFPRHPLPASMPIIITFRNYISNIHQNYISFIYSLIRLPTTSFTLRPPIDVLSHYNYIQNTHLELHSFFIRLLTPRLPFYLHYNCIQNYILTYIILTL